MESRIQDKWSVAKTIHAAKEQKIQVNIENLVNLYFKTKVHQIEANAKENALKSLYWRIIQLVEAVNEWKITIEKYKITWIVSNKTNLCWGKHLHGQKMEKGVSVPYELAADDAVKGLDNYPQNHRP